MRAKKCLRLHLTQGICTAERVVLFHGTRFRIALSAHDFYCPVCDKVRSIWFINR